MENNRQRRAERKKRKQQRQAIGCCCIAALAVTLGVFFVIFTALGGSRLFDGPQERMHANPYTPADFVTYGDYLQCTAGETRLGVDVSEYQEQIDWEQVRAAGFDFAFIRIGYRGYTTGSIQEDDLARENLEAAKAAGMDVGVYFYAQAVSAVEAAEEARWCLDFLDGMHLDLPVVYDWEYVSSTARTGSVDKGTLTECVKVFCDAVAKEGYQGMVYFNPHVGSDLLDLEELQEYPWWLAMYSDRMDYPHRVDIWQYTEEGSVPGINGSVDIDIMFLY